MSCRAVATLYDLWFGVVWTVAKFLLNLVSIPNSVCSSNEQLCPDFQQAVVGVAQHLITHRSGHEKHLINKDKESNIK